MKKVLLINPPIYFSEGLPQAVDVSVPPLGILYLASYLNKNLSNIRAEVLDVAAENASIKEIVSMIKRKKYFVVGISSMTPQLQGTLELARVLKEKFSKTIKLFLGGPHISADPDFLKRHQEFDYGITGEAEKTFADSVLKLSKGKKIPALQRGVPIMDLDEIPFPDKKLIDRKKYSDYESMLFTRGCPYSCYYCSRPAIDKKVRCRSGENLIEEIKYVYPFCKGKIDFQDDSFTINRNKVIDFCKLAIDQKMDLRWRCNTRIDLVDKDLLTLMKKAGCELIHFGIESGSENVRRDIVNKGRFSNAEIRKVFNLCKELGIKVAGYFMIGHPGETKKNLEQTGKMILNYHVDVLGLSIPTPFPGSKLYDIAEERGIINVKIIDNFAEKKLGEGYSGNYPVLTSEKLDKKFVFDYMKKINRKFYLNFETVLGRLKEDFTSLEKLRKDFSDFLSLVKKGMSSRKPYSLKERKIGSKGKKIVFVSMATENIAIEFLSSFLKEKGYDVDLVFDPRVFATEAFDFKKMAKFFDISKEIVKEINEKKPDLIGFSVFTFNYQRSLELARMIKKSGQKAPIIFGGIHPTSVPERVIKQDCVDIVCVGEGEYPLIELFESLDSKERKTDIENLWFKKGKKIIKNPCRKLITDLDKLPFPDKELFYNVYPDFIKGDYSALSSRGCPFACTYCGNNVLRRTFLGLGKPVRRRSPENMVDELVWAKKKFGIKKITFVDDVFGQDYEWIKRFANDYKKRVNLPYVMITHPLFMKESIVKLLVNSGCYFLLFGVQSVSEKTRRDVLKRYESNKDIINASKVCHKYGLKFSVDHIFNIPKEGLKEQEDALSFYNKIRPSIINSYWLQYFPRTEIIKTALAEKVVNKKMVEKIEEGQTSTSLVIGLGNKDTFSPERIYANFQFFFMLLPVLPKAFTNWVIKKKLYLRKFSPPMLLNISLKAIINFLNKRGTVYWGIAKSTLHFMKYSFLLKVRHRGPLR